MALDRKVRILRALPTYARVDQMSSFLCTSIFGGQNGQTKHESKKNFFNHIDHIDPLNAFVLKLQNLYKVSIEAIESSIGSSD